MKDNKSPGRLATIYSRVDASYALDEVRDIFDPKSPHLCFNGGLGERGKRFVVVDSFVLEKWGERIEAYFAARGVEAKIVAFEGGENNKSVDVYVQLLAALEQFQVDRRAEPIIAIGGGVLTDVVGFVASTYRRGVPLIRVPTTLMGMVDAAIGVKNGINFDGAKNRVGSFAPPLAVFIDYQFLRYLSSRHISNGMGEIAKISLISDKALFRKLIQIKSAPTYAAFEREAGREILRHSIRSMARELQPNLWEGSLERAADFGHTFSPMLEMAFQHFLHGEMVSLDVALSSIIARGRDLISKGDLLSILALLEGFRLPTRIVLSSPEILWEAVLERTRHRGGRQNVPLPGPIGNCTFINNLTKIEVINAYHQSQNISETPRNARTGSLL